jgi:hypothetical protein
MISLDERQRMQAPQGAAIKNELEQLEQEASEFGRYSLHMAIALSVVFSLAVVAIISKRNLTNYLWADVAAFAVPVPVALYFKKRIVLLGAFAYVAALILFLGASVVFGI